MDEEIHAEEVHDIKEYPKWVTPHETHVVREPNVLTPLWPQFHVGRDYVVTVLVADADEEAMAIAAVESVKVAAHAVDAPSVEVPVEAHEIEEEPKPASEDDDLESSNTLIH